MARRLCSRVKNSGRALELQRASSFVPIYRAQCPITFHRDMPPPLLNPDHTFSAIVAALLAVTQLEVALLLSPLGCLASRTHIVLSPCTSSICPVHLERTCGAAFAPTSVLPSDDWLKEVARPVTLPLAASGRAPPSSSPPSSSLRLLVVVFLPNELCLLCDRTSTTQYICRHGITNPRLVGSNGALLPYTVVASRRPLQATFVVVQVPLHRLYSVASPQPVLFLFFLRRVLFFITSP